MDCGNGSGVRFNRKSNNANERKMISQYWEEIVGLYGTYIDYFQYDYQVSAHDYFYGEQPLAPFVVPPRGFPVLAEFNNDSMLLAKFGIQTDADVTFIIPIETYYTQFGYYSEPKAGDLIRMTELGWDRPGGMQDIDRPETPPITACEDITDPLQGLCEDGLVDKLPIDCHTDSALSTAYDDPESFSKLVRGAQVYEITERRDENLSLHYNMLQGHYVWIIHAKRFDYSYQPNAPREPGSEQVSDDTNYGLISSDKIFNGFPETSALPFPEDSKSPPYDQNVENEADDEWMYHGDDDVYGKY